MSKSPPDTHSDRPTDLLSLPDEHVWGNDVMKNRTVPELEYVQLAETVDVHSTFNTHDLKIKRGDLGYIIKGVQTAKQRSVITDTIEFPGTFNNLKEFDPYIARTTTSCGAGGWGISQTQLEKVIRFVSGGGMFSIDILPALKGEDSRPRWDITVRG